MDVFFAEGRITYKIIGGILDFYFFIPKDSKPNSVLHSYTDLVGKPFMPCLYLGAIVYMQNVYLILFSFFFLQLNGCWVGTIADTDTGTLITFSGLSTDTRKPTFPVSFF